MFFIQSMKIICKEVVEKLSSIFLSLSIPLRLFMFFIPCRREIYIIESQNESVTNKGNISQHLKIFSYGKLIRSSMVSNKAFYNIKDDRANIFLKILRLICDKCNKESSLLSIS